MKRLCSRAVVPLAMLLLSAVLCVYVYRMPESVADPLPVLMYHHMVPDGQDCNDMTVTPGKFRSDLDAILFIFQKMPGVNATIHTHQPCATALGLIADVFPACLVSQIDALQGDVPVAPFTPSSDKGMGELTVQYANGSNAVILRSHGVMAFGSSLQIALYAAVYLEEAAQTYLTALATGRQVQPLSPEMVKAELGEPDSWANYLQT